MKAPTIAGVLGRMVRAHALGGRAVGVVEAVRRAGFIYGSAPTCHLAVQARVRSYSPRQLDDAVLRARDLVRLRAMRGSVYLVPRELVPHALALTKILPVAHYAKLAGIAERAYAPLTERIERIVGDQPRTAAEIRETLGTRAPSGAGVSALLGRMNREGRIVRARVRGTERSQNYEYARMSDWIELPEARPTVGEALRALAPAWLAANGPATAADLAWWAGTSLGEASSALDALGARPIAVRGLDGALVATEELRDELGRANADEDAHLIPCWDSYAMAHRDRARYLDEAHRPLVIDAMGNVTNLILHRGRVAGIWDLDGDKFLYAPLAAVPRHAVEAAAARLAPLHAVGAVVEVRAPGPLAKNAFLAPLKRKPAARR